MKTQYKRAMDDVHDLQLLTTRRIVNLILDATDLDMLEIKKLLLDINCLIDIRLGLRKIEKELKGELC